MLIKIMEGERTHRLKSKRTAQSADARGDKHKINL